MTNMIIGQGYVLVTPLQVAVAYGAVATGKLLKPHLLKEVRNASGDVAASVKVETAGELDVPEADLAFMRDALNGVATDNADVSKLLNEQGIDPATVACKTGTAEYTNMADTAWFACYAPVDDPQYVVACVVEHGRGGPAGREGSGGCACQRVRGGSGRRHGRDRRSHRQGPRRRGRRDVRRPYRLDEARKGGVMPQLPQIDSVKAPDKIVAQATRARRFPWLNIPFILVVALLVSYGLVVVMSAVANDRDYSFTNQLAGVALGIVFMVLVWRFDYRRLSDFTMLFLIVNVALILSPHIPGLGTDAGMGAQSWLKLGIQVQPGEFAKITVILLDASIMARYGGRLDDPREYVKALGLMLVPFACIMTQPDLGTGLVYLCIGAVALVVGGARPKYLLITLAAFVAAVIAVFVVDQIIYNSTGEYKLLKQYQRNRLLVFLDPDIDPTGESYNLKQAQIAIGSGGLFGKGLFQGTQHTLGILPEAPTDFIFCVLAEELGFLGVMALLALYAGLVLISFRIAGASSDLFGITIDMCVVGMWLFQILENIGMDCGLMPITGIPLPFVSYGATGMVMNFIMLGMIGSVWTHNIQKQR